MTFFSLGNVSCWAPRPLTAHVWRHMSSSHLPDWMICWFMNCSVHEACLMMELNSSGIFNFNVIDAFKIIQEHKTRDRNVNGVTQVISVYCGNFYMFIVNIFNLLILDLKIPLPYYILVFQHFKIRYYFPSIKIWVSPKLLGLF